MHQTDAALHAHLSTMHGALSSLIAIESRAVTMPKPSKMPLAVDMADDLTPVLTDLYWFPLRNGIDSAPQDEEELRPWLQRQLEKPAAVAALLALLLRFHKRAANYGGTIALELLELLELAGTFSLTNADYLAAIEERGTMLTTVGSEMSLIDTTVNDLAREIPAARKSNDNTLTVLGAYIAMKALSRSTGVATFEVPWGFSNGLEWTYGQNKVKRWMYDINGMGCEELCAPLHGRIIGEGLPRNGVRIPQHSGCDCIWTPITDGWVKPGEVWAGA